MTQMQRQGPNGAYVILFLMVLGVTVPASAQTGTEPRVWTTVSVQGRVGRDSSWRWAADSLVRTRNGTRTRDFMAEWFSANRDLTRRSSVGIGYAYGAAFSDSGSRPEQRLVQQYTWRAGSTWRVAFRTQLEERFISGDDAMVVRMRQLVRTTWPLVARGRLHGVASGEVFVNAITGSSVRAARGFESSQVFLGIGRRVSEQCRVEVGYVNVYSPGASISRRHGHVLSTTLVVSM